MFSSGVQSSAAVDVRVGHLSDPAELPGLAHFTEHMLFYASEKYPKEDEYSKFISEVSDSFQPHTLTGPMLRSRV